MSSQKNRRILLIDDNASIHDDFKKILIPEQDKSANLDGLRAAFLSGDSAPAEPAVEKQDQEAIEFELTSAHQGEEGFRVLCEACERDEPFAMAFVDMRMPPGWDGVQTIAALWERDPDLQVVVCTAFSDYTWEETVAELGQTDRLLILKKPFDPIEIFQLASALTEKWNATKRAENLLEEVRRAEMEARAYASSLETVNRTLVTAKAAADMASDLKTEFLVQLSNEVSSKLAEVLGNVEHLRAPVDSDGEDQVEAVLDVGRHLMQTITEILDVTTLEAGEVQIEENACDPRILTRSVLDSFEGAAGSKGLTLDCSFDGALPGTIHTEERHLRKLLESLVDNAVRCTTSGTVSVRLSLASTESWQRPRMQFEITDTGPGIPRERLGTIFEPCARDDSEGRQSGFGFGLALSKRLASLLGGDLTARSEVGQGSVFCLTLEVSTQSQQQAA